MFYTLRLWSLANIIQVYEMNTPALSIILISTSRSFLKYNCRFLRGLHAEAKSSQTHGPQRQAFRELEAVFEESPVTVLQFEQLLSELDSGIKTAYLTSQTSDSDRKIAEKEMLVSAKTPSILIPALESFLTTAVENLRGKINEAELYFTDISWLGLSDDSRSNYWRKNHILDVLRKIELPKGGRLKRCTRCCAIVEDKTPQKGSSLWMLNLQRTCFCGNWWMVGEK